jgi:hypothetical protein
MSRSYRSVRPKTHRPYMVEDVLELYKIHENTVTNWKKVGLRPVDARQPQLFCGSELKWFHDQRSLKRKRQKRTGEFKCFTCKAHVIPNVETLELEAPDRGLARARAICPECNGKLRTMLNETQYDKLRTCVQNNTSLLSIDEGSGAFPVGIVKDEAFSKQPPTWNPENERALAEFWIWLKKSEPKTAHAILAAVRDLEAVFGRKTFWTLTERDVDAYRDDLIRRSRITGAGSISRSTMQHRASYVRTFLDWIVNQDLGREMPRLLSSYLVLRRSDVAEALQPPPRDIPTRAELERILTKMPVKTLIQRRDRAAIAASNLFGTRSNTTASLRIGMIDIAARKVLLDTTVVRIKNSKSQSPAWFLGQKLAEDIFVAWIEELTAKGGHPDDALFPPDLNLAHEKRLTRTSPGSIEPWKTDASVRRAFRNGCKQAGVIYFNPHSIKHYLKSVRDEVCRTPEHRKAYSYNLGHENEKITEVNYDKMTDARRDAIFRTLHAGNVETEDEKDLLLALHEHQLTPGTPDHELALKLDEQRRLRRKGTK